MSCRILEGKEGCCFFDSVTMTAFGPVFDDAEQAEAFMTWLAQDKDRWTFSPVYQVRTPDPRAYSASQLEKLHSEFICSLAQQGGA